MPRSVTLFTGQWADLRLEQLASAVTKMDYDGVELACWGDHFDVEQVLWSNKYCDQLLQLLSDPGLT